MGGVAGRAVGEYLKSSTRSALAYDMLKQFGKGPAWVDQLGSSLAKGVGTAVFEAMAIVDAARSPRH
jgi:hypothetical protein